jgi:hypothetical protein
VFSGTGSRDSVVPICPVFFVTLATSHAARTSPLQNAQAERTTSIVRADILAAATGPQKREVRRQGRGSYGERVRREPSGATPDNPPARRRIHYRADEVCGSERRVVLKPEDGLIAAPRVCDHAM